MTRKEAFQKKMQAQRDKWAAEIDKLQAKADKAKADVQINYFKQLEGLRSGREEAGRKLAELREAGDDAWEDFKAGLESAWASLGHAVRSASSRFN